MDGTDAFKSTAQGPSGNPFGDQPYSDQFVRSATQPLARKTTRPLEITPEVVQQRLHAAEEQIQLCRIIIERFSPRVRLLRAATDSLRQPSAQAPAPSKKLGLGKGPKKPAPVQATPGISPQDRAIVDKIAKRLSANPGLGRRATIAVTQFDDAGRGVIETHAKLNQLRTLEPATAMAQLELLDISKLQGRIYPICNFYEVFKDDELLSQLFPPPNQAQDMPPRTPARRLS